MNDPQSGMVRILQATLDAEAQGPGDMTERVRAATDDIPAGRFTDLVMMLRSSRCLDVTTEHNETGQPVISSINGITTRGLRELQKASEAPRAVHSCPTDGEEGRLGFHGA